MDNVILRVVQLCTTILTEEQVDLARFDRYIEGYLQKDEVVDPYIEKLHPADHARGGPHPPARSRFEDIHLVLMDLVKLSRIPYATFSAVGKILYREVRRSHLLALLIDKKFKPIHDRIKNPAVAAVIRGIRRPRASASRRPRCSWSCSGSSTTWSTRTREGLDEDALQNTILVFSLITSETRLLLGLHREAGPARTRTTIGRSTSSTTPSSTACPSSSRRSSTPSCIDISVSRQADSVRTRVENSHGILKDCFQQSIVQLAQALRPRDRGAATSSRTSRPSSSSRCGCATAWPG